MLNSSSRNATDAYSKVSIETGVLAADPHQLIVLLFDGAIKAISNAIQQMEVGNVPEKGRLITKAVAIIENGLQASLNKKVGGELALNLDKLYAYFTKELVMANGRNDTGRLIEIKNLLTELRSAWLKITPTKAFQVAPVNAPVNTDPLAPRILNHFSA